MHASDERKMYRGASFEKGTTWHVDGRSLTFIKGAFSGTERWTSLQQRGGKREQKKKRVRKEDEKKKVRESEKDTKKKKDCESEVPKSNR